MTKMVPDMCKISKITHKKQVSQAYTSNHLSEYPRAGGHLWSLYNQGIHQITNFLLIQPKPGIGICTFNLMSLCAAYQMTDYLWNSSGLEVCNF